MALFRCHECGREISTMATSCPGCGVIINNRGSGNLTDIDIANMVCKWCGRKAYYWHVERRTDGSTYVKCQCGGIPN